MFKFFLLLVCLIFTVNCSLAQKSMRSGSSKIFAENVVKFDQDPIGALPEKWISGITGQGNSQWTIVADPLSLGGNVLLQSAVGDFPWCVLKNLSLQDGFVETKFMAISGEEDQAGGVVWRFKDASNYYVARANALEDNVSLYYTENGIRNTILYVENAPVFKNQWNTLRVEFQGANIKVFLNRVKYIDLEDTRISGSGAAGLWTKADSKTAFQEFRYGN